MEFPLPQPIDPAAVAAAEQQTLSPINERRMRRLLDVLCDPTRLKIVRALRDNELAASDSASTSRVAAGSITPSSQSRAVE